MRQWNTWYSSGYLRDYGFKAWAADSVSITSVYPFLCYPQPKHLAKYGVEYKIKTSTVVHILVKFVYLGVVVA
jgi:hypothetical protein